MKQPKTVPNLSGVPETMLWTLYNRAHEARRDDRIFDDAESVRIFESLDYDFPRSFGSPDPAHAIRAVESDRLVRTFMAAHPGCTVVSLGEGLDTQALRVDDGKVRWVTVDVPEAIAVRSRFIPTTGRRIHLARSALEYAWMDAVDPSRGVFVVAQGLFMYFEERHVRELVAKLATRFPGAELFFDVIPRWFSERTVKGAQRTRHYRLPPMPWGVDGHEIDSTLRAFSPRVADVTVIPYRLPRGYLRVLLALMRATPGLKHRVPCMVHVRFS